MKKVLSTSGETLVEVLAAAAVFLLMMGIMQGAISFCTNAQHKAEAMQDNHAKILEALRTTDITADKEAEYSFKAISSDGSSQSGTLFRVNVGLGQKEVTYQDEAGADQTVIFHLFAPTLDAGGGADP